MCLQSESSYVSYLLHPPQISKAFCVSSHLWSLVFVRGMHSLAVSLCSVSWLLDLCVCCRASRSVQAGFSSAEYEVRLTKVICQEAFLRAKGNLTGLTDDASLERDASLKTVAQQLCSNGSIIQVHPLSDWVQSTQTGHAPSIPLTQGYFYILYWSTIACYIHLLHIVYSNTM